MAASGARPSSGLQDLLERVDRILGRAVERMVQTFGSEAAHDPFRGLYISPRDAGRLSATPRSSPILGVADAEMPLVDLLDRGSTFAGLAREFGLSSFDLEVIAIALAPETELAYERLYAFLQDDVSRRRPSVDLVLNLLCSTTEAKLARRDHFAADAPLVREELIELVADPGPLPPPLLGRFVKLDDAVVSFLLGEEGLDARISRSCELVEPDVARRRATTAREDLRDLASVVITARATAEPVRLYFSGPPDGAKRDAAEMLASEAGVQLIAVDVQAMFDSAEDAGFLTRLLVREARLHDAIIYLEPVDARPAVEDARRRLLLDALDRHPGIAIIAGSPAEPPRGRGARGIVTVDFPIPSHVERSGYWREALTRAGIPISSEYLEQLAGRFRLTRDQIRDAVTSARHVALWRAHHSGPRHGPEEVHVSDLFEAARGRSGAGLSGLARKIEPVHDWGQIALPVDTLAQLRELCQQVVERHQVLERWGFARRMSLGRGVTALFAGPSGTGKTLAADIIARELGLDLYTVDLSGVVSKYIGETEKNLERIFSSAENANAILFFDEADALFGKRSEVRDSHDRYANIEIAYLLQQMEQYEGVAILATNLRQNMDEAFVRRLQFVVEFPFPDAEQRTAIWQLLFPEAADRDEDIDFDLFATQFRITGGSIKNIVLAGAFLAAADGLPIGTAHLLRAARREYHKMGKVLGDAELEPFTARVAA